MKSSRTLLAALFAATAFTASIPAMAAGDAAAGEKKFAACKACHTTVVGKNAVGPSLAGVVGRKAGTAEGFKYSDNVAKSGVTWDEASLDKWLTNPKEFIAGNKMGFPGLKEAADRENVIAYLKTLK